MSCCCSTMVNVVFGDSTVLVGDMSVLVTVVAVEATQQVKAAQRFKQTMLSSVEEMSSEKLPKELRELPPGTGIILETKLGEKIQLTMEQNQTFTPGDGNTLLLQRLRQQYAYHKSKKEMTAHGFNIVAEDVAADGGIRLLGRRWRKSKEEFEVFIPVDGHVTYRAIGIPHPASENTVEKLSSQLGQIVMRRFREPRESVVRIYTHPKS